MRWLALESKMLSAAAYDDSKRRCKAFCVSDVLLHNRRTHGHAEPTEEELLSSLLDQLPKDYKKPEDILGEQGLIKRLSKAVLERALGAELTDHLGYEKHNPAGRGSGNSRNGTTGKTLKGKSGEIQLDVPRDRNGTFEPQIVKKHQTRFDGFDDKIDERRNILCDDMRASQID
jgi:hypothetical protein